MILEKIAEKMSLWNTKDTLLLPGQPVTQEKVDLARFHEIISKQPKQRIAFVDGGNTQLILSPQLSLDMIRVAAVVLAGDKYTTPLKLDFYLLTTLQQQNNAFFFQSEIFFDEQMKQAHPALTASLLTLPSLLHLDTEDPRLTTLQHRAPISLAGSLARRFTELLASEVMLSALAQDDILVLDGSLEALYPSEEKLLHQLAQHAQSACVSLLGLSKTSQLITQQGNSAANFLQTLAPFPCWLYIPQHQSVLQTSFVHLHQQSEHVFRLDSDPILSSDTLKAAVASLAADASDPVFYGYPYGLIKVDSTARVSHQEKEYVLTKLLALAGSEGNVLQRLFSSTNAHSILDHVRY